MFWLLFMATTVVAAKNLHNATARAAHALVNKTELVLHALETVNASHSIVSTAFLSSESYRNVSAQYLSDHQDSINVFFHTLFAPIAVLGVLVIISSISNHKITGLLCIFHQVLLSLFGVSFRAWFTSSLLLAFLWMVASSSRPRVPVGLALFAAGLSGQSIAQLYTGELSTALGLSFFSHGEVNWLYTTIEQVLLILPLVTEAGQAVLTCPQWLLLGAIATALLPHVFKEWFPWQLKYNQLLQTRFAADDEDLEAVREWVLSKNPLQDYVTHWGRDSLSAEAGEAFDNIASSQEISDMLHARFPRERYTVSLLPELNNVAVAGHADYVYPPHLHAPFVVFPLASVFKCVVALSDNTEISDHFSLVQRPITADVGDCFAFDINREIHYVTHDSALRNPGPRVVMELHYAVYNSRVRPLGALLGYLTTKFRQNFSPEHLSFPLSQVLYVLSYLFAVTEEKFGFCNILYMLLLWQLNAIHPFFLAFGTSYVHYFRYMNTYHHASLEVSAGRFRRDAFLYKSCAMLWLAYYYTNGFDIYTYKPDFLSLGVAAIGFAISSLAMKALGMDATYFGVELGIAKPRWITDFPYGVVPHPMIVGQIIGILGLYIDPSFRQRAPFMALGHVALYLVHMFQENYFLPSKYGKAE